jgi:hypothetical protein
VAGIASPKIVKEYYMAHKSRYIAGKKKKNQVAKHPVSTLARSAEPNEMPAVPIQVLAAKPANVPVVAAAVRYANLPRDLRQVAMLAAIIIVLLVVAWLILK